MRTLWLVLGGVVLGVAIWGVLLFVHQRPTVDSLFVSCQPAFAERELMLRLTVVEYEQACASFNWLFYPQDEFHHLIRLNNYGMHDALTTLDRPDDVYRILLIGDEATQAWEVPLERTFATLAEQQLNTGGSLRYEIVNLSYSNPDVYTYGTDRELMLFSVLGGSFRPDAVVLAVNMGNDIADNDLQLQTLKFGSVPSRPFFGLEDDALVLYNSPLLNPGDLDTPAYNWLTQMQANQRPAPERDLPPQPRVAEREPYTLDYPVELGIYLPPDRHWEHAWGLTESLIVTFRDLAEQQGAAFGVLLLPDRRVVHRADWVMAVNDFPVLGEAEPLAPTDRLTDFLQGENIPVANLADTLGAAAVRDPYTRLYYILDPRLNENGHALVAERLVSWLRAEGLLAREEAET